MSEYTDVPAGCSWCLWLQNALPSFQMNEKGELITIDGIFMGAKALTNFAIHCLGKKVIADLSVEIIFTVRKRSLGQGNIFTSVCQKFCSLGGSAPLHAGIPPLPLGKADPSPWQGRPPPLAQCVPGDRSTSGRYASYWNVILYKTKFQSMW